MTILMSGLDHSKAALSRREKLSFTKNAAADMVRALAESPEVCGAVLLGVYLLFGKEDTPDERA